MTGTAALLCLQYGASGGRKEKDVVVKGAQTKLGATKGVTKCPKVNSLAMLLDVCILGRLSSKEET